VDISKMASIPPLPPFPFILYFLIGLNSKVGNLLKIKWIKKNNIGIGRIQPNSNQNSSPKKSISNPSIQIQS
jgi:hypothetical protein